MADTQKLQRDLVALADEIKNLEYLNTFDFKKCWEIVSREIESRMAQLNGAVETKMGEGVNHSYINGKISELLWLKYLPSTIYGVRRTEYNELSKELETTLAKAKEDDHLRRET